MLTRTEFEAKCTELLRSRSGNTVDVPGVGAVTMYDEPLIGFAAADDEIFERFRDPEAIGENFMEPGEWLDNAGTVVSLFFPFSEAVRSSNRNTPNEPSAEWLYARIEGQSFIGEYMKQLSAELSGRGIEACVPALDERFGVKIEFVDTPAGPDFHADSRWSERHAAYACGLGTFGISRGLITERGMAGRFASIIISAQYAPGTRKYSGIYDYCIRCGACIRRCPVGAISLEHIKNNIRCNEYVEKMKAKYSPRYACGKCQVGVPCEFRKPLNG